MANDIRDPQDSEAEAGKTADYFVADSFSFGVEREMKESGEKGGTEDINIGVGELQETTISKSMDLDGEGSTLANLSQTEGSEPVEIGGGRDLLLGGQGTDLDVDVEAL